MIDVKHRSLTNVVEGFSHRLNLLMDRARFPQDNRVVLGSRRFGVVYHTFKSWCVDDKIPGSHAALVELVQALLSDIPSSGHNVRAVTAWLLAGDAVPNPFADDDTDALSVVELYIKISEVAKWEGMDFDQLPREARSVILQQARAMLRQNATAADGSQTIDSATRAAIAGMLKTARVIT